MLLQVEDMAKKQEDRHSAEEHTVFALLNEEKRVCNLIMSEIVAQVCAR